MPERDVELELAHHLTRIDGKALAYADEPYYREALADLADTWPDDDVVRRVLDLAIVMVKPDGLAAGRLPHVLGFLREHEVEVVGAAWVPLRGHTWRELWRYQLMAATLDRLRANALVLDGEGLLLLVRASGRDLPASVYLSSRKGSASVELQTPDCLRARLGQPNRVLSHVHVADEPIDVVRELGLLLPTAVRRALLRDVDTARPSGAVPAEVEAALAAPVPHPDGLVLADALDRLERLALDPATPGPRPALDALARAVDDVRAGRTVGWRALEPVLADLDLPRWDLALLVTSGLVADRAGVPKAVLGVETVTWLPVTTPR